MDLPNFFKVSDNLYRGGQPTREGFKRLKEMGIKGVINLRYDHSDLADLEDLNLNYLQIPCHEWHPEKEDVNLFLKTANDSRFIPCFVHCIFGADRTGMMVAAYRIFTQGWEVDRAIDEMIHGGFGFHWIWQPFIKHFLKKYSI